MIFVAVEHSLAGIIALSDEPKPEASRVVSHLHARGIEVWMVTGDNEHTAHHMASRLGITRVLAAVKPHEKGEKVKELQASDWPCFSKSADLEIREDRGRGDIAVQYSVCRSNAGGGARAEDGWGNGGGESGRRSKGSVGARIENEG